MNDRQRYSIEVFWSDDDEGYIATAPDLPGCSAWGASPEEAAVEIQPAIDAWIESARSVGNPIPQPAKSRSLDEHSGKFVVRMPRTLHASLAREAELEGTSLNQYVVYLLADRHAREAGSRKQVPVPSEKKVWHLETIDVLNFRRTEPSEILFFSCAREIPIDSPIIIDLQPGVKVLSEDSQSLASTEREMH